MQYQGSLVVIITFCCLRVNTLFVYLLSDSMTQHNGVRNLLYSSIQKTDEQLQLQLYGYSTPQQSGNCIPSENVCIPSPPVIYESLDDIQYEVPRLDDPQYEVPISSPEVEHAYSTFEGEHQYHTPIEHNLN